MFNLKTIFVIVDKSIASKDVEDILEVVLMHAITNINILVLDNFVDNIECVLMLIIVEKKYIEIITNNFIDVVKDIFIKIVSTIFFA